MAAIANFVGWRHQSRDSPPWNNWRYWLFCCYYRHGRRVNSLCQISERLLFFTQAFVGPLHFWSHTSLVTRLVYSSASARRTAPRFGKCTYYQLCKQNQGKFSLFEFCNSVCFVYCPSVKRKIQHIYYVLLCSSASARRTAPRFGERTYYQLCKQEQGKIPLFEFCSQVIAFANENMGNILYSSPIA